MPALRIPLGETDVTTNEVRKGRSNGSHDGTQARELDISNAEVDLQPVMIADLPKCPRCNNGLLRPGVVWFGEPLPRKVISTIDKFITESDKIDLIIVIGTSAKVYPAAGYVDRARAKGSRVAVVNMDRADAPASGVSDQDWFFQGDASEIVPEILRAIVGETTHTHWS